MKQSWYDDENAWLVMEHFVLQPKIFLGKLWESWKFLIFQQPVS